MTKDMAKKQLIKTLIPFVISTIVFFFVALFALAGEYSILLIIASSIVAGFEISAFIVGWKHVSRFIPIVTLLGLLIKIFIISILGMIIYPIILIKDIVVFVKAA